MFCGPHRYCRIFYRIISWSAWDKVALIQQVKLCLQCRTVAEDHDLDLILVKSCACGSKWPQFTPGKV